MNENIVPDNRMEPGYRPFLCRFTFAESPCLNRTSFLDSLLIKLSTDKDLGADIPLARTGGVYHASIWFAEGGVMGLDVLRLTRVAPLKDLALYQKGCRETPKPVLAKGAESSGPLRAFLPVYRTIGRESVVYYGMGDVEAVRDLLSGCSHLGAKKSLGRGRLACPPVIEEIDQDRSLVWEGQAMRPLPLSFANQVQDADLGEFRLEAPYYIKAERVLCILPTGALMLQA